MIYIPVSQSVCIYGTYICVCMHVNICVRVCSSMSVTCVFVYSASVCVFECARNSIL